jgi:hypothetical protein
MARSVAFLTMLGLLAAPAAGAQETLSMRFDVRFGPVRAADVRIEAEQDARRYRIRGTAESTGIVGLIRDFRFDLAADGTREGNVYRPAFFMGDIDTGWHETQVEMQYLAGVPTVLSLSPEDTVADWTLDAAAQTGTLDPLTALLALIWPGPRADLCGVTLDTFDGRRRGRLMLAAPMQEGADLVCAGLYQRVAGFPPEDMANYDRLHFTVVFETTGNGDWRLARAVTQTPYGRMRLVPRD